ncbi:hypothetical protein VTO42DRAFT_4043 [Malbranchea cinnamomea]
MRQKRNQQHKHHKRIQVVDEEGWTHVTSSTKNPVTRSRLPVPAVEDKLAPAEIPDGFTFQKLKDTYEWHKSRWQTSETWESVKKVLEVEVGKSTKELHNCVCIGLGSLSGLLRGGLVDRRSISLFQLAALTSILEYISQPEIPVTIGKCYAQDPVFNFLDKEFLDSIGIEVLEDPDAFALVDDRTFLYAPGAERTHLSQLLSKDPAIFFGGPLEDPLVTNDTSADKNSLEAFSRLRCSKLLPEFEPNDTAFWRMSLYWKQAASDIIVPDANDNRTNPVEG